MTKRIQGNFALYTIYIQENQAYRISLKAKELGMGRCEMGDLRKSTLAFFEIFHLGQYQK